MATPPAQTPLPSHDPTATCWPATHASHAVPAAGYAHAPVPLAHAGAPQG